MLLKLKPVVEISGKVSFLYFMPSVMIEPSMGSAMRAQIKSTQVGGLASHRNLLEELNFKGK